MAEASVKTERVLEFPLSQLEHLNGFSMDFGGSVVKIVYLAKEDWEKRSPDSTDPGKVRMTSFAREEFDDALEFLKTKVYIRRESPGNTPGEKGEPKGKPVIYTCGLGGNQFGKRIEEELNVRTTNENEMDCFQATMEYFAEYMEVPEYCVPVPQKIRDNAKVEALNSTEMFAGLTEKGLAKFHFKDSWKQILEKEHDPNKNIQPYLLGTFGSAWAVIGFTDDRLQSMVNMSVVAGRSFLGLGRILTGAKTYQELMALAEKGNNLNIDMTTAGVAERNEDSKDEEDLYSVFRDMPPRPVFCWGQAVTKDPSEFSKEDIARTLLYTMCQILVTVAMDSLLITRCRHIFLGGGFPSHPLVAEIIQDEFEVRKWQAATAMDITDGDLHLHILKYGSHLGALGAFLDQNNKVKSGR